MYACRSATTAAPAVPPPPEEETVVSRVGGCYWCITCHAMSPSYFLRVRTQTSALAHPTPRLASRWLPMPRVVPATQPLSLSRLPNNLTHSHTLPHSLSPTLCQIGDEFYMVSIRPLLEGGASVVAFHPRTRERLETVLDTSQSSTVPSVHILNQPPPRPLCTACCCLCCRAAILICLLLDAVACCACCFLLLLLALLGGPGTVSKGDGQWEGLRGRMHIERDSDGVGTLVIDMPGDADGGASSHK